MAVKGTVASADFQPDGEMTDLARPPDDPDVIERPAERPTARLPKRETRRRRRRAKRG